MRSGRCTEVDAFSRNRHVYICGLHMARRCTCDRSCVQGSGMELHDAGRNRKSGQRKRAELYLSHRYQNRTESNPQHTMKVTGCRLPHMRGGRNNRFCGEAGDPAKDIGGL